MKPVVGGHCGSSTIDIIMPTCGAGALWQSAMALSCGCAICAVMLLGTLLAGREQQRELGTG